MQLINTILHSNGYPSQTHIHKKRQSKNRTSNTSQKQKWITFTYIGNETRTITRLFKNTNLRIAYKTNNTIRNHLQPKNHDTDKYKYNCSGIYQIKCNSCQLKYIGQTGRNFRTPYKEHIRAIHSNKTTSRYAQHILDTRHTYGTIEDTLDILHFEKKRPVIEHPRTVSHIQTQ
jgi:hypothetical protein